MPDASPTNHQLAEDADRIAFVWFKAASRERRLMLDIAIRLRADAVEIARLRNMECQERVAART